MFFFTSQTNEALYKNKLTLKLYQQIKILYHVHMIGGEGRGPLLY